VERERDEARKILGELDVDASTIMWVGV
jgi:hypothetical protein